MDNLDFNGALNVLKLTDVFQQIEGMKDPVFKSIKATVSAIDYPFTIEFIAKSGYFELSDDVATLFNWIEKI